MKKSDLVPALLMLGLSAALVLETRKLSFWADTTPGPAFVPVWLGIAGALLCMLRILEARRIRTAAEWPERPALFRVGLILAGLVAVPLLSSVLGLILALALFIAFLLLVVLRQRVVPSLATLAVTIGLIYAIFVVWLRVPLPTGMLGF